MIRYVRCVCIYGITIFVRQPRQRNPQGEWFARSLIALALVRRPRRPLHASAESHRRRGSTTTAISIQSPLMSPKDSNPSYIPSPIVMNTRPHITARSPRGRSPPRGRPPSTLPSHSRRTPPLPLPHPPPPRPRATPDLNPATP